MNYQHSRSQLIIRRFSQMEPSKYNTIQSRMQRFKRLSETSPAFNEVLDDIYNSHTVSIKLLDKAAKMLNES